MLSRFSIKISQFVEISEPEVSNKSWKSLDYVEKSRKSRFVSTISICLDDLDKYLDEDKSRPKNLDFKNLDRDKIKVDLDVMDNLDGFQKLVSTAKDVLDLDWSRRRDHQAYLKLKSLNSNSIILDRGLNSDRIDFWNWRQDVFVIVKRSIFLPSPTLFPLPNT
jgi:hypothetical protein